VRWINIGLDFKFITTMGHKRKRSLHDAPVDLSKMQLAKQRLQALQEELSGIEETTEEMNQIMTHVDALQDILDTTKKPVRAVFTSLFSPRPFLNKITCRNMDFPPYRRTIC
jgi:hypothetical protein